MANRTVVPPELTSAVGMIESCRAELQRITEPTEYDRGQLVGLTTALALLMVATATPAVNGLAVR